MHELTQTSRVYDKWNNGGMDETRSPTAATCMNLLKVLEYKVSGISDKTRLPTAATCMNLLKLPEYQVSGTSPFIFAESSLLQCIMVPKIVGKMICKIPFFWRSELMLS